MSPHGAAASDAWEHATIFFLRPVLAVSFVLALILLSWFVAWRTVLVHVPLVQEIFGLRKKIVKPKPPNRHRLSKFYYSDAPERSSKFDMETNLKYLWKFGTKKNLEQKNEVSVLILI